MIRTKYDGWFYLIYKTTNLVNGKIYVGRRKTKKLNDGYIGSGTAFNNAVDKYGVDMFKREVIEYCVSFEHMIVQEVFWIKEHDARNKKIGYNIHEGGKGGDIYNLLPVYVQNKIKKAVGDAHRGTFVELYGVERAKEIKEKGHPTRRGIPSGNAGKKHIATKEQCNNISVALAGVPKSEIHRQHLREANLGKTHTEASNQKHRETCTKQEYKDLIKIVMDNRPMLICPHCGKLGKSGFMYHWHFDNCKMNPNRVIPPQRELRICPHCGFQSRATNITQFHFDNCKFNPNRVLTQEQIEKEKETNIKKGASNRGRVHSMESSKRKSDSFKKQPYTTCEYCGMQSQNKSLMLRYHGGNCKHNPNRTVESVNIKQLATA
jgi:hypothetical protein